MEKNDYISKLLKELVLEGFFIKKEDFKQHKLTIKDIIYEDVYNKKFPDIKSYKSVYGKDKSDICGFYALYYTLNYIKYILNNRDIYYLYKNTNRKSFFKFYKRFIPFFISNMSELEKYEIEELNKEGSLERHHLDYILKNKLLFKFMGSKYNDLLNKYITDENNLFEFEWFDFVSNNFAIEIPKIKKLNNIFKEISECVKIPPSNNKIFFLYIGLIEHWILIIYDSFNKNYFIEIDSYKETKDIIKLNYLDENKIKEFINKVNEDSVKSKMKPLTEYSKSQFYIFIKDTQRLFYKLNYLILKNNNKEINIGLSIIEERCNTFIDDFNNLKINKDDKLNELLIIYNWFATEYHPKRIKEDFFDMMKDLEINQMNCNNKIIQKFFSLIKELNNDLKENIKLIEQEDIKEILEKGLNVFEEINNI